MIAAGAGMEADLEKFANGFEDTEEGRSGIDHYHAANANFEEDFLEEGNGKVMGGNRGDRDGNAELRHVAHAREQIRLAIVGVGLTG